MARLAVSIVVHRSPLPVLKRTLACLHRAGEQALRQGLIRAVEVTVVDNASGADYLAQLAALLRPWGKTVRLLAGRTNLGYGRGHNRVATLAVDYRLVLNPDVFLAPDALVQVLTFLRDNPDIGVVVPRACDGQGGHLYLCKRYPGVFTLLLRGFAPPRLQRRFRHLLAAYEMRDLDWNRVRTDLELVSGCCLLLRGSVWERIGGFDPGYFLYFEDFDLALRARQVTRLAYLPRFTITHLGGHAARKGWRHRWWFVRSAWRFYRRHGWRWV
ncbi:MAG TPA: glycosyltransferase family 2 protein [Sedimenticola sp.]|nr:glycosyltransferase family 2 protein [Sedimenticola sp.]